MKLIILETNVFIILFISKYLIAGVASIEVATTMPSKLQNILKKANLSDIKQLFNETRRIINGYEARNTRPYMVYLKLPSNNPKYKDYRRWLCGGVIIHEEYILTSAACIEDAKHFYVVSGTYRFNEEFDRHNNPCIKNGAKKAVWKCIPRNYIFDGHENDNIRWMSNDIAIVKVEDDFNFDRRIRGCDFVPRPICYNNQSQKLEEPGTVASIAGWGTTDKYNEWIHRRSDTIFQDLLATDVIIVPKDRCKNRWGTRYHNIIDNYMICSKDIVPDLSEICQEKYADCTDVMYSEDYSSKDARRTDTNESIVHSAHHHNVDFRRYSGGFCENDHGGPLINGDGANAVVIGIISACLVKERTNKCHGPFLYTSVFKNRALINCAIYKDIKGDCSKLFRTSETHFEEVMSWADHPDGPAKNEIAKMRRNDEKDNTTAPVNTTKPTPFDTIIKHGGVVLRASEDRDLKVNSTSNK